jgi:glycosyltransferase involved in cell wall biosynthesis
MRGPTAESAQKAHDILLQAWLAGALGTRHNGELHLLGDGNLRPALEMTARGDQTVKFHGIATNAHDWLLAADWLVMPSRYEGLPIAGIEAVCTGTPCLFSDIPPLRDLDASGVIYSAAGDAISLQSALMVAAGRQEYVEEDVVANRRTQFSIAHAADQYLKTYEAGTA